MICKPSKLNISFDESNDIEHERSSLFLQTVTVDGVRVNAFDILASNGVVHIIDAVMIAPAGDIVTQLNDHYDFTTLVSKVTQAGLAGDLMGKQRHQ